MKRLLILSLSVLLLSFAGCQRGTPKRKPGMTDSQYEYALEQHRVNEAYRDIQEWDNEHYMRKFGQPLHPNVYAKPYKDERTEAEKMLQQAPDNHDPVRPLPAEWLDPITTEPEPPVVPIRYHITPW